jgi:hypothetical protein
VVYHGLLDSGTTLQSTEDEDEGANLVHRDKQLFKLRQYAHTLIHKYANTQIRKYAMQCNVARASRFQNAVKQSRVVAHLRLRGVEA